MSYGYLQGRSDAYQDVLGGRGELLSSQLGHSPSYFDTASSLHPDLKESLDHDLKREYEIDARRNYERERELEDEREVVGRGYLHEREEIERDRRAELERDRRLDVSRGGGGSVRARNTKVVIDNLPFSVKWPELKEFMKKVGEVAFADVFTDSSGKSKGAGIVEYVGIEGADRALNELDGQDLLGRRLSVREDRYPEVSDELKRSALGLGRSVPFLPPASSAPGDPSCTVFVGNLDYDVSWQKLKDVFRVVGMVLRTDVFSDKDGRSRGYGTVEFSRPKEALNAIIMFHGQMLNNRPMLVRMDKANLGSNEMPALRVVRGQEAPRTPLGGVERKRRELTFREIEADRSQDDRIVSRRYLDSFALSRDPIDSYRRLRDPYDDLILTRDLRRESLLDRYRDPAPDPIYARDLLDSYPLPAPKRSRVSLLNRSFSPPPARRDFGLRRSDGPLRAPKSGTGGPNRSVFVRNLPYSISWQDLKDLFRDSGFVASAEVAKDDTGKSRGFGLVTFETNEEAKLAIEKFDGHEMKGRKLEVRMDKYE